jgi:agmatine/peptidylarginine deiminase
VLDGGNVVAWTDKVIVCDKVFGENPRWRPSRLLRRLRGLFGVERVIVIPTEPGDVFGHADGVVRFIDDNLVVVNDYGKVDANYRRRLIRRLSKEGFQLVEAPYEPSSGHFKGIPSAIGNYVNFLQVGPVIILPIYGGEADDKAREVLRRTFPGFHVLTLSPRGLAAEGGVLNCISWTVRGLGDELASG